MRTDDRQFTVNFICRNCKNRNVDVSYSQEEKVYQGKHAGVQTHTPAIILECNCGSYDRFLIFNKKP